MSTISQFCFVQFFVEWIIYYGYFHFFLFSFTKMLWYNLFNASVAINYYLCYLYKTYSMHLLPCHIVLQTKKVIILLCHQLWSFIVTKKHYTSIYLFVNTVLVIEDTFLFITIVYHVRMSNKNKLMQINISPFNTNLMFTYLMILRIKEYHFKLWYFPIKKGQQCYCFSFLFKYFSRKKLQQSHMLFLNQGNWFLIENN